MDYQVVNRPKLSRNKYGEVENKGEIGGANSLFSPTSSSYTEGGGAGKTENINDFVGSTATEDGKHGLVPAPKSNVNEIQGTLNDNVKFLKGNGSWVDIPISRYTAENINKDGIDFDGNLSISDTLTTQTLNVLGSAHFWELVIDKVKATGGNLLITPASMEVDYVGGIIDYPVDEDESPYTEMFFSQNDETGILGLKELFSSNNVSTLKARRLYQKNADSDNQIVSEFVIGDMVRCKTLNLDEDNGFTNKDYWTFVLATGTETYNNESCLYIDVLYQYVANGTTYGVGTTLQYNNTPSTTPVYHDNEMFSDNSPYAVIIFSEDVSNGCYVSLNSDYDGNVRWDGAKWTFEVSGAEVYPGTSEEISCYGGILLLECVNDNRFNSPVLKVSDIYGNGGLGNYLTIIGNFYTDTYTPSQIDLAEFTFGYGDFNPEVGDNIVSLGHLWEGDRQGAILISSIDPMDTELKAPAIAQYEGINKFTSLSPFRTTSLAANGNNFTGKFFVNYDGNNIDINERINIFSTDITTGLEKVGIHLDGDNSTIKMVGSVEVRQNDDGEVDTLTVWDDDDIMRVKVSPEAIPSLSNISTSINPTSTKNFNTISGFTPPDSGGIMYQHSYKYFLWETWDHQWKYWTNNAYFNYISTIDIGTFSVGQKFTVSNLNTSIRSKAYFKYNDYVSTRSETGHTQSIGDVIIRLKRYNGSTWSTVQTYNVSSTASKTVSAESATISLPSTIINDFTVSTAGKYRLDLEIVHNVYATYTLTQEDPYAYFTFDYSVRSSIDLTQPSASMTRIGSNGLAFNTDSTGQYLYAGNDGIKVKWGDDELTLSTNTGFKTNYSTTYITSNSSKYLQTKDSFVIATSLDSDTTIYLPSVDSYGVGRVLTVLGNDFITLKTYSSTESIYTPIGTGDSTSGTPSASTNAFSGNRTFTMSSTWTTSEPDGDGGTYNVYHRNHTPLVRLVCSGSGWYLI